MSKSNWIPAVGCIMLGVACLVGVRLLYVVAPCSTFSSGGFGGGPPGFFFGIIWPALVPVIVFMTSLSIWRHEKESGKKWIVIVWLVIAAVMLFGWYDGYLETYLWWRNSGGAPWPKYC